MKPLGLAASLAAGTVLLAVAAPAARPAPPEPAPTAAVDDERLEVPPPPFSDGIFPCSGCHADLKPNRTRRALDGDARRHRAPARRAAPLVPRLPRRRRPRLAAPGERRADPLRASRTCCAASATARSSATGGPACTAGGPGQWNGHKQLPAVRPLPQPAPAALPPAGAEAGPAGGPSGRDAGGTGGTRRWTRSDETATLPSRRQFVTCGRGRGGGLASSTSCGPRRLRELPRERLREIAARAGAAVHAAAIRPR